jgi:hypothetical protein
MSLGIQLIDNYSVLGFIYQSVVPYVFQKSDFQDYSKPKLYGAILL